MLKLVLFILFTVVVTAALVFCLRSGRFSYRGLTGTRAETPGRYWAVIAFLAAFAAAGAWSTIRLAQVVLAV